MRVAVIGGENPRCRYRNQAKCPWRIPQSSGGWKLRSIIVAKANATLGTKDSSWKLKTASGQSE